MQQASSEQPRRREEPLPEAREVVSNIWKLTIPIPFPLRTVNMYALVGREGWALVDTGIGTPDARAALKVGLERAGLRIADLRSIVLTHHHPDHIGLSGELHRLSGARVYMHPIDEATLQTSQRGAIEKRFSFVSQFLKQHGMPDTGLWLSQVDPEIVRNMISIPPHEAITPIEDGESIDLVGDHYRVVWTPGHSDGQICLFREQDGVFLAADHVLPRITPNIGLYSQHNRPNPLGDYLHSLAKVASLPARIVLPGHGEPFSDLATRTAEIAQHHTEREQSLLEMLAQEPQSAYQLTRQLFKHRSMDDESWRMATAEVLSHLEHLRYNHRVAQQQIADNLTIYAIV
jgi:glyoxylase-like metal-dependent hydrolase (beta-lactamase superfamily II)